MGRRSVSRAGKPAVIRLGIDLAEVERSFDEWTRQSTNVAEQAREYYRNRLRELALSGTDRRAAIAAACEQAVSRGVYVDERGRKIVCVRTGPRLRRRLTSEAVRGVDGQWWAASRVRQVRLGVRCEGLTVSVPALRDHSVDALVMSMEGDRAALSRAKQAQADARGVLVSVFEAVSQMTVWCGEPLVTSDGWTLGYEASDVFSAARASELADDYGVDVESVMVTVPVGGSVSWRVIDAESEDDPDGQLYVP